MEGMGCAIAFGIIVLLVVLLWPLWLGLAIDHWVRGVNARREARSLIQAEVAVGELLKQSDAAATEFQEELAALTATASEQWELHFSEIRRKAEDAYRTARGDFAEKVADARASLCGQEVTSRLMLLNWMSDLLEPIHYVGGIEGAVCFYLGSASQVLDIHHWVGDSNSVPMPPDAILAHALAIGSTAVALAHNHPNNNSAPSDQDVWHAAGLVGVLQAAGITLTEDYVWCHNKYKSVLNTRRFKELAGPV